MIELNEALPQLAELEPDFRTQGSVYPVVEEDELRFLRIQGVLPDQDVAWVCVAVDVAELEDHFPEGFDQEIGAFERLQIQDGLDVCLVVDFDRVPNELHCNQTARGVFFEDFRDVDVFIVLVVFFGQ